MGISGNLDAKFTLNQFYSLAEKKHENSTSGCICYKYPTGVKQLELPDAKKINYVQMQAFKNRDGGLQKLMRTSSDALWNNRCILSKPLHEYRHLMLGKEMIPEENKVLVNLKAVLKSIENVEQKSMESFVQEIHYAPLEGKIEEIFWQKMRAFDTLKKEVIKSSTPIMKGLDPLRSNFSYTAVLSEQKMNEILYCANNHIKFALELQERDPLIYTPSTKTVATPNTKKSLVGQLKTQMFPVQILSINAQKSILQNLENGYSRVQRYFNEMGKPVLTSRLSDFSI